MTNLQETIERIREVGIDNSRVIESKSKGKSHIQIKNKSEWTTILTIDSRLAEDVIRQARTNLICG